MLKSLQSLRGIFAFLIFVCHNRGFIKSIPDGFGHLGVTFFFILSAFVLCSGYYERIVTNQFSYRTFVFKRFWKVYPLHIFCFVFWCVFLGDYRHILSIPSVCNVLLIQSWVSNYGHWFSCNGVSWYLSTWLFCIVVFPVVVKVVNLNLQRIPVLICILVVLYLICIVITPENGTYGLFYIHPIFRLLDFVFGIWLWNLYKTSPLRSDLFYINTTKATILQISIVVLYAFLIYVNNLGIINEKISWTSLWWIPSCLLIYTFACLDKVDTIINKILRSKMLIWFAEVNFTFFMTHQMIINVWVKYIGYPGALGRGDITFVLIFTLCVLFAAGVHKFVEEPISWAVNSFLNKGQRVSNELQ